MECLPATQWNGKHTHYKTENHRLPFLDSAREPHPDTSPAPISQTDDPTAEFALNRPAHPRVPSSYS